jgi:DNA (cytosine-5)-methyltransferase 1
VGIDIKFQKNYPFEFHCADALEYLREHGHEFDAIHASPPCQAYSAMTKGLWREREYPDLVEPTRTLLKASGKPWVIENVRGAPVVPAFTLCGTMFGLRTRFGSQLQRHRHFESPWLEFCLIPPCQHDRTAGNSICVCGASQGTNRRRPATVGVWGNAGGTSVRGGCQQFSTNERREAMGIDWMSGNELSQAIPPAYTEFIGKRLLEAMEATR